MEANAKVKYVRVAPRKARLVAGLIRGLSANEAEAELFLSPKRASTHIIKLLRSAIANAKGMKMKTEGLYVKEIRVDGGPMLKRWKARARGSAGRIQKKTSHITIILGESDKAPKHGFTILKKEKHDNKKSVKELKGKPKQQEVEKKIEKKGPDKKGEKRTFFRRKSV